MRVTGHDQAAIEGAIRQCAPATRQKDEGRDWNDYAQRTAAKQDRAETPAGPTDDSHQWFAQCSTFVISLSQA
ncbi:MAG: hypothetical protein E5299_02225 [Burkholderia gladioli]|nr:MAG: hypothetical protein E5299_02225 [Burkholderia gladioli]